MSLIRYDCFCPKCNYYAQVKESHDPKCPECGDKLEIDKFRLHEWSVLEGKRVQMKSYVYRDHDFKNEIGTVIDVDGPGEVIWIEMDKKFSLLTETHNTIIIDKFAAKSRGISGSRELFEDVTMEID